MVHDAYHAIADLLDIEAVKVREIEGLAKSELYENKDEDAYRELMRKKALLLSSLADQVNEAVQVLEVKDKTFVMDRIDRFALSASQSLQINSVFFMSALLYSEEYKEGDKNDLELFAESVRSMKLQN
ncbi:hypothetical protein [Maridesulfovibrio frigidus]|uniref:hypothetical protein n=1 Tax=Maridesulfovibrio frigidus TaxID=340956 RepID=UPI0004E180BA|nr:hypothetical protein [Maridesulfovibrio frigidus]